MTEDFVSYELAVKLKAAGFDEPCDHYYTPEIWHEGYIEYPMLLWEQTPINSNDIIYFDERVSAPSLWQAQKWLREKHHISVRVSYIAYHKVWFADWLNLDSGEFDDTDATFATYEEALSDGIETVLELIKKGE